MKRVLLQISVVLVCAILGETENATNKLEDLNKTFHFQDAILS